MFKVVQHKPRVQTGDDMSLLQCRWLAQPTSSNKFMHSLQDWYQVWNYVNVTKTYLTDNAVDAQC